MTRRDNGLEPAASYVPLADVDPPLSDHVLQVLRDAGVAAYIEPLAGETGPYRDVRPPPRPTSRLFVDRRSADLARSVVRRTLPGLRADFLADAAARRDAADMREGEVDAAWSAIIAGYAQTAPDPGLSRRLIRRSDLEAGAAAAGAAGQSEAQAIDGRAVEGQAVEGQAVEGQAVEENGPGSVPAVDPGRDHDPASRGTRAPADAFRVEDEDWQPPRTADVPDPLDDPTDHFVPPPPPPLPSGDRVTRFAWLGVLGGPVLLLMTSLLGLDPILGGVAVAGFIAGFVTLVARMQDRVEQDDSGDDGAVV